MGRKGYKVRLAGEWDQGPCGGHQELRCRKERPRLGDRLARGDAGSHRWQLL